MRAEDYVNLALERTKARIKTNDLVTGLLGLLALLLAYLLTVIVVDQTSPLEQSTRVTLLAILGLVAFVGLCGILAWPLVRRVNDLFAARLIERSAQDRFRNSLVAFVELRGALDVPADIRAALEVKAARDLGSIDVELVVNRKPLYWASALLAVVVILAAVFALSARKSFGDSFGRAVGMNLEPPTATRIIDVQPSDGTEIMAGNDVRISADLAGKEPKAVTVRMTHDDRYWDLAPMTSLGGGAWELVVSNVLRDLKFSVRAGDARSSEITVHVRPLPVVTDVRTRLTYPAYTMRAPEVRDTGNVEALVGTTVEVVAQLNQPPGQAPLLVFGSGSQLQMEPLPGKNEARVSFTVDKADSYHVSFRDKTLRYVNAGAIQYEIKPVADQPPTVELSGISSTAGEMRVPVNGHVAAVVRAMDDYGLDRVEARWQTVRPIKDARVTEARETSDGGLGPQKSLLLHHVAANQAVLQVADRHLLKVADLGLKEGDRAVLWFVATDRRAAGAQEGRSVALRLVIAPPEQGGGGGTTASENKGGGGKPKENGTGQASGGGTSEQKTTSLTPEQRQGMQEFEKAVEKIKKAAGAGPSPDTMDTGSKQPSGSGAGQPKNPQETGPKKPEAGGSGTATSPNPGPQKPKEGPASSPNERPGPRSPDVEPGQRLTNPGESGAAGGLPEKDAELLKTVGPAIKRVAGEMRRGTVDPALLKELGWSETELRSFVSAYEDRFGNFAGTASGGTEPGTVVRPPETAVGTTSGAGNTGAGSTASPRGPGDNIQENIETQKHRVSPRYSTLIEEYLRAVSEAETNGK